MQQHRLSDRTARAWGWALASALALGVTAQAGAVRAITLADLELGGSFQSTGGELSFDFAPGSVQSVGLDLSQITVVPLADGFELSGPMIAVGGAFASLTLDYSLTALGGATVDGAGLLITAVAIGAGALAVVGETLSNGAGLAALATGTGVEQLTDQQALAQTPALGVTTAAQLVTALPADVVSLQTLRQTFAVAIPEPSSMALVLAGLVGLAVMGNRRPPARRERRRTT